MRFLAILPFAILTVAAPAAAQENAAAVYDSAMAALVRNDCKSAVPLLERYKKMDAAKLAAHPAFAAQVDLQIRKCNTLLIALRDRVIIPADGKVVIQGHKVVIDGRPAGISASVQ